MIRVTSPPLPLLLLLSAVVVAGCHRGLHDTGYAGTWERANAQAASRLSIVREGDGYRFRWNAATADGSWKVSCDWDGKCEETTDGKPVGRFTFSTRVDEVTHNLHVRCAGERLTPQHEAVSYEDELLLRRGGLTLVSRTIEADGSPLACPRCPKRRFAKISDAVEDPPRPAAGG